MKKIFLLMMLICGTMLVFGCTQNKTVTNEAKDTTQVESSITNNVIESVNDMKVENEDKVMLEKILAQFNEFTKYPRPTLHEEKISEYLYNWAKSRNIDVIKDDVNNIIMEVPATPGKENLNKIILQAHMDMVFSSNENLDPLTTTINAVRDGDYLKSDGRTSLGADDGIGLAIALMIIEGNAEHAPIRLIVTVNEENGMKGAMNIDKSLFNDSKYLINIDSEESDTVTVSSAGSVIGSFEKENELIAPTLNKCLSIDISGLMSGHSGLDIDKNRLNAIVTIGKALNELTNNGIDYEISDFNGGTANNAIPAKANAIITIKDTDLDNATTRISDFLTNVKNEYAESEPNMSFEITECDLPEKVISTDNSKKIVNLVSNIVEGIYTMSKDIDGLVESSSNLGLLSLDNGKLFIEAYVRSSVQDLMTEIISKDEEIAKSCDVNVTTKVIAESWPVKVDSRLLDVTKKTYKKLFNEDIKVAAIHAGLECGTFAKYNSELDIVSIGPDVTKPHTVEEKLYIPSIMKTWNLLKNIIVDDELS